MLNPISDTLYNYKAERLDNTSVSLKYWQEVLQFADNLYPHASKILNFHVICVAEQYMQFAADCKFEWSNCVVNILKQFPHKGKSNIRTTCDSE
jgi:hypothetical protein